MDEQESENSGPEKRPEYVVGIGASAGGLEALEGLLRLVPKKTGLAFVVIQHLATDFKSMMKELLGRYTDVPILVAEDQLEVLADHIYLLPPGMSMILAQGRLLLEQRDASEKLVMPIDNFFRSLAADCGDHAIAVILSGTGSDGTRGIEAIKEQRGLVLCQTLESAKFDGMPRSARDSGHVDVFLSPEEIAAALLRYVSNPDVQLRASSDFHGELKEIESLLVLLHDEFGVDFSLYKPTTLVRRAHRRMQILELKDVDEYAAMLQSNRKELRALFQDMLIGVTQFLRDPEAFEALREKGFHAIIADKKPSDAIRIWVAGCATGEEAYTIAILLHETMAQLKCSASVKIFATDLFLPSVEFASRGVYTKEVLLPLGEERIDTYFELTPDGYRVASFLRSMVVFAQHDIIQDVPFTRLDLVTCRNLLIYLQPVAQQKALSLLHFGLRPQGIMMLGPSESVSPYEQELSVLDNSAKLFQKRRNVQLGGPFSTPSKVGMKRLHQTRSQAQNELLIGYYDAILSEFMPMGFLISHDRRLLHIFGGAGELLSFADGRPSDDLFACIIPELRVFISSGFHRAMRKEAELDYKHVKLPFPSKEGDPEQRFDCLFRRVTHPRELTPAVLVRFVPSSMVLPAVESSEESPAAGTEANTSEYSPVLFGDMRARIEEMEAELSYTQENLQSSIEQLEVSNEEFQATNEELMASNQELQSTNEELNSVNEELYTVNAEFYQKIDELTVLSADMDALLQSTELLVVFLDEKGLIRRFTPQAAEFFRLVPHDVGRSFDTFSVPLQYPELHEHLQAVSEGADIPPREITTEDGRWFLCRVLPYRKAGQICGAVITLIDITEIQKAREFFDVAFHAQSQGLLLVDRLGEIILANESAHQMLGAEHDGLSGTFLWSWMELRNSNEYLHPLQQMLQELKPGQASLRAEVQLDPVEQKPFPAHMTIAPAKDERGVHALISLADARHSTEMPDKLELAQAQLSGILEHAAAHIYVKDLEGRMLLANPSLCRILGLPAEEILGRRTHEFVAQKQAQEHTDNDLEVIRTGEPLHTYEEFIKGDVEHTYLSVKFPIFDSQQQIIAVGGISTDVTEQIEASAAVKNALVQREQFLAMLSHELRNPLSAAVYALEMLRRSDSPEMRESCQDVIERQLSQLRRLLDDLLDVARVSEGKIALDRVPTDIVELVTESIQTVQNLLDQKDQTLDVAMPDEPLIVHGDVTRLQQIVVNLLTNASRFSPEGKAIAITLEAEGEMVKLMIKDQGVGIAPEHVHTIFELFNQADVKVDRARGGLGIGLTLVKQLVQLHGGNVYADSEGQGRGATFTVLLPHYSASQSQLPSTARPEQIERVLVVDDNEDLVSMIRAALIQEELEVAIAFDGLEALRRAERFRPDAVVLDIGLPRLNGLEVAARLRANPRLAHVLLIAVTGYGQKKDVRRSMAAGFDHHLIKPFTMKDLLDLLPRTSPE